MATTAQPAPRPRGRWRGPLLAGFCFGLGYGVTQRMLALQLPALVQLRQGFEVRAFPGTSLESLRLRFGTEAEEVRGDLEVLELERQAKQREQERRDAERSEAEADQRRQAEQQAEESRRQGEQDALEAPLAPAVPDPEPTPPADAAPPGAAPQAPVLPGPVP